MAVVRCAWVPDDPVYRAYHDQEWGVPVHDGRALFAKLVLDGFQAGLSWWAVLQRRDAFERVFEGFDPDRLAAWDDARIEAALADPGIIRNRAKVRAAVTNARAYVALRERGVDFAELLWSFTGGRTIRGNWTSIDRIPAETPGSQAMSKALKKAGFSFVGPTICYAFMQAVGIVNDHTVDCFRHGVA